jgi:D-alanine-D-alanine ligase
MEKALIYHTNINLKTAKEDDLDVLNQAKFVSKALSRLGYEPVIKPFSLNFSDEITYSSKGIEKEIAQIKPAFIFNLVEAVNGKESLSYLAPKVFDDLKVYYTGCPKNAFKSTANKISAKNQLIKEGIKTPYFLTQEDLSKKDILGKKFIVKSYMDHSSKGLGTTLYSTKDSINNILKSKGNDFFAEEYIDGREFNVSVIGPSKKGIVLPVAELVFKDWEKGKPKIVDYRAKWELTSKEYSLTVRSFDLKKQDERLVNDLKSICEKCWNSFDLRGYARIDFRVSNNNEPYVLEINTNPCISPDAGFIAAAEKAGMSHEQIIGKIVEFSGYKPKK